MLTHFNVSVGGDVVPRIANPASLLTVNDLHHHHDGFVRNAIVERYLLNRRGTSDRACPMKGLDSPMKHIVSNADITDCKGLTTETVTCCSELVCNMFTDKLRPYSTNLISDFEMKKRAERYEDGDFNRTIRLNTQYSVELIQAYNPPVVLKFFPPAADYITSFRKVLKQPYLYSWLSVLVYEALPAKKQIEFLTVKFLMVFLTKTSRHGSGEANSI